MARQHRFRLLTHRAAALGLALLLSPLAAIAQDAPAPSAPPAGPEEEELHDGPPPPPHGRFEGRGRRHGRGERPPFPPREHGPDPSTLSPEERRRFEENQKRWDALSPEDKEAVRKHHEERRSRMKQSIDRAIEESGLKLTEEQRREFAHRFMQERRQIEQGLRKEMNQKRKEAVDALIKRLATEFKEAPKAEKAE